MLNRSNPMSRFEIAEQLGVSPRVVSRYIDWLSEHGVPVKSSQPCQTCPALWEVKWTSADCLEWLRAVIG